MEKTTERLCNRKACRAPDAVCQHTQTGEWYCVYCARLINRNNFEGLVRIPTPPDRPDGAETGGAT
jgi:hypothetical protein